VMLFLAFSCLCMGIIVVWSEEVFSLYRWGVNTELSIFAHMLKPDDLPFGLQWLFVFVPMAYMSACCYSSLFKINFFGLYRLIPHHQTNAPSLIYNSMYIARLTFPIAYNFMLMSRTVDSGRAGEEVIKTAFGEIYARPIRALPLWVDTLNFVFPIILIVLCILTFFDVWSRFILTCCIKSVQRFCGVYHESNSAEQIVQGKEFIMEERELKRQGRAFTIDSIGLQQENRFAVEDENGPASPPPTPFKIRDMWSKMTSVTAAATNKVTASVEMSTKPSKPAHKTNNTKVEGIRAKYSRLDNSSD